MSSDKLVQALYNVLQAEREEEAARYRGGYDWGYYGLRWAEARHKAEEEFQAALDETIDARVRAVLIKSGLLVAGG